MRYSFIGDTTYALLLYLLYADEKRINNTTFYIGNNLSPCNLQNKVVMPKVCDFSETGIFKYRLKNIRHCINICHSKIYAQDHLPFSSALLGSSKYVLLEDCPNFFSNIDHAFQLKIKATWRMRISNLLAGSTHKDIKGYNNTCIDRIVTSIADVECLSKYKLKYNHVNIEELWNKSSQQKRILIKNIFGCKDINRYSDKPVVFFSQPIIDDAHFSQEEFVSLLSPYFQKFGTRNILVKLHPRDTFDYKRYFPEVETLYTKAPQQLLSLMGFRFSTAITICSSAVSSVDKDCEVIWIGAECDSRIVKAYGHVINPKNSNKE